MDSVLLQYSLGGRKPWRGIDVVSSVIKDRCLREKFACSSLVVNLQKKTIYITNSFLNYTDLLGNIDFIIVTSVMKDRCLREKFACLSLAENIQKKII